MGSKRIVVLTALPLEARAVRRFLPTLTRNNLPTGTIVEETALPGSGYSICLVCTGPGNGQAGVIAERVISWADPAAVLFVGVAGALKPGIALGDVVAATQVDDYRGGKETPTGFKARPKTWDASHMLVQVAQYVEANQLWTKSLPGTDYPVPNVHFKPIASGDVVKDASDSPMARLLDATYNDAAAIEMEAAGVAQAAQHRNVDLLVIRGISDASDGNKASSDTGGWQERAAQNAAAFALGVITELPSPVPAGEPVSRPGSTTRVGSATEPDWSLLGHAADVSWRTGLQRPYGTEPATLELHLVPVSASTRLQVVQLQTLWTELAQLGRARSLFSQAGAIEGEPTSDGAVAFARDVRAGTNTGLAVMRTGQRSAWEALPKTGGLSVAVFDPEYIAARLTILLELLLALPVPLSVRIVPAAGIEPAMLLTRGKVNTPPVGNGVSIGMNQQPVRTETVESVSADSLRTAVARVAEELAARLDQALGSRR